LLFADVTGFTAFSAGLEALGRSGKEYTVALLNRLFASLVQVAMHHGGDILAFGGDALLVTFNGAESAKAAATAAWEMQEVVVSSGFRGGVYWRSEP
jgi:class 3 adenylate cyclase